MGIFKPDVASVRPERDAADLANSVAVVQRQCQEILEQVKALGESLSQLAVRESQLRAVLERDASLEPHYEQLLKIVGKETTAGYIAAAIERAPLKLEPFPYTVVDDILPPRLYKCLLRGIPPVELFAGKVSHKQHLDVPFGLAPKYSHRVWRFMADVVIPEIVAPAIIAKFRPSIDDWISRNWPGLPPSSVELHGSGGRIMLRRRGYRIAPHRDPKWGFITCILYLARPHDSEAWGTQIYAVEGDQEAKNAAPYWIDPRNCRLVEDVANRPNRMLVFLNSTGAHGAHIPADAQPETLERYIYQVRVGPTLDCISMLKSMLPEERRSLWAGKALVDY
jgi:hypothetical protein